MSSGSEPCRIQIKVRDAYVFEAKQSGINVKMNFTTSRVLPSLAKSESEAYALLSLGENTKNSMLLTLIIPFGFMLFMSVSMNRVWSLYLMLQLTCNLMNLKLNRPSNAEYIMFISENISSFKIAEEANVKFFVKNYVF